MLKTRIVTALALLAVLLPVLLFNNFVVFAVIVTVFFGAAIWEAFRLFNPDGKRAALIAVFWTGAFAYGFFFTPGGTRNPQFWFPICVAIWVIRAVCHHIQSVRDSLPPLAALALETLGRTPPPRAGRGPYRHGPHAN